MSAHPGLDKTAIGDYLGEASLCFVVRRPLPAFDEDKPFNKSALFALVDGLDFKAQARCGPPRPLVLDFVLQLDEPGIRQSLDGSLRHFLSYFRLPGEAWAWTFALLRRQSKARSGRPRKSIG